MPSKTIWIKTRWKREDLNQKRVEFEIPVKSGTAGGLGEFWVKGPNNEGFLSVDIVTHAQGTDWAECIQTRFHLPQTAEKKIVRHPKPDVAEFLVK